MLLTPLMLLVISTCPTSTDATDRPIIGILAQATTSDFHEAFPELNFTTYIAASYVKHVEEAGARAAPVLTNQPMEYYQKLFTQLNGLLLPGGEATLGESEYSAVAKIFWDLTHENRDVYFPIWGTCLGHEQIAFLAGGLPVIRACHAENQAVAVELVDDITHRSRIFANASQDEINLFTMGRNVVMFHSNCVRPDSFTADSASELVGLAYSTDKNGYRYNAILEHRSLPIYGVQFHPEKTEYEWSTLERVNQVPHTAEAIAATRYIAEFLVSEARKSSNRFKDPSEEQASLIYNYKPEFTASRGMSFEECYFF